MKGTVTNLWSRGAKRWPLALMVSCCVAAVTVALTGAAKTVPGLEFLQDGHWVASPAIGLVVHVNGTSKSADAEAAMPELEPGSQVVQGETSGYVVGQSRIVEFGKSNLTVEKTTATPTGEKPVAVEVEGGPYLVYREAGLIVRLGDQIATINAGGPLGEPVTAGGGTLWVHRTDNGSLCRLPKGADRPSCPAIAPSGHTGALTVVGNKPVFVDTSADTFSTIEDNGFGKSVLIGLDVPPTAKLAPTDAAGKIAILDPAWHRVHLVDTARLSNDRPTVRPVTVDLPDGDYVGPAVTGSSVVLLDRSRNQVHTYSSEGGGRKVTPIPVEQGEPRLTRGEDSRVYVDGAEGKHVSVVDPDGAVTPVPVVGGKKPDAPREPVLPPAEQPAPPRAPEPQPRPQPDPGPTRTVPKTVPPPTKRAPATNPAPPPPAPPKELPASPPGAPINVTATAGNGSAVVTWGAAAPNGAPVTAYHVRWQSASGGGQVTLNGGARTHELTGLSNGVSYQVTVVAENRAGRGAAGSVQVTPAVPKKITVSQGEPVTYNENCRAPDCAEMHVTLSGFQPNTRVTITAHTDAPNYNDPGEWENRTAQTVKRDGTVYFEGFSFGAVGYYVWITADGVQSDRLRWERG